MNHYTYLITYTTGKKYIGVRSCKCLPEEDTNYIGSSKYTNKYHWFNKKLNIHDYASCGEMGIKYGGSGKPAKNYRDIVKGIAKSYKGWILNTDKI